MSTLLLCISSLHLNGKAGQSPNPQKRLPANSWLMKEHTSNVNRSSQEILFLSKILKSGNVISMEGPESVYSDVTLLFRLKKYTNSVLIRHSSFLFFFLSRPFSRMVFNCFQLIGYDFPVVSTLVAKIQKFAILQKFQWYNSNKHLSL